MLNGRKIHVCVSGGVAAYKAVETVRLLQKAGATVQVAMTPNAQRFVGPLTFQAITHAPVLTETLDPSAEMEIGHIAFAQKCDALLLVPATANSLAKLAHGLADEVVSTVLLAARADVTPVLVAPAMNTAMWDNPATQANLATLRSRGIRVVAPDAGQLACGAVGPGRLAEPEALVAAVIDALAPPRLRGLRVLVTAGPTHEHLDPVRFLGNPSTGKAGVAIAAALQRAGAQVTLVHGPISVPIPSGVEGVPVVSARDMHAAVFAAFEAAPPDVAILTAAVSDFRPANVAPMKIKKGDASLTLDLVRNPDILADLGHARTGPRPLLIGFAAETGDPIAYARRKLLDKRCDLIVANDVTAPGAGFGTETNRVHLVTGDGVETLPLQLKTTIAERLVTWIADRLASGLTPSGPTRCASGDRPGAPA